jgi:hypothetical protein
VLAIHELTWTRGNSAGPSVDADAVALKLNVKATVTPNMTEYRLNLRAKNSADEWVFTTAPCVTRFIWEDSGNEKRDVDVRQFSFSKQLVSKSEGHCERREKFSCEGNTLAEIREARRATC